MLFVVPLCLRGELEAPLYLPQSTNPQDVVVPQEPPPSSQENATEITIYEWVDEAGALHFTDREEKIPPGYRNRVHTRKMKRSPPAAIPQEPAPSSSSGEGEDAHPITTTAEWQQRYEALIQRYRTTYGEYMAARARLARAVEMGKPPGELELIRAEIRALALALKELKEEIVAFPKELMRHHEPTYWVKPWSELKLQDPEEP